MISLSPLHGKGTLYSLGSSCMRTKCFGNSSKNYYVFSYISRFISEVEAVCRLWLADGPKNLLVSFSVLETFPFFFP